MWTTPDQYCSIISAFESNQILCNALAADWKLNSALTPEHLLIEISHSSREADSSTDREYSHSAQMLSQLDIPEKHRQGLVMPPSNSIPGNSIPGNNISCVRLNPNNNQSNHIIKIHPGKPADIRRYTSEFIQVTFHSVF